MQIAIISVIGFFGLWGVVFFVCLLSAPGKLDADRLAEIDSQASTNTELRKQLEGLEEQAKKDPIEEHKKQRVRQWLDAMQPEQRSLVEALFTQGEQDFDPALAHRRPEYYSTIEAGRARGFVAERREMRGPFGFRMIRISPDYSTAFYKVLHIEK